MKLQAIGLIFLAIVKCQLFENINKGPQGAQGFLQAPNPIFSGGLPPQPTIFQTINDNKNDTIPDPSQSFDPSSLNQINNQGLPKFLETNSNLNSFDQFLSNLNPNNNNNNNNLGNPASGNTQNTAVGPLQGNIPAFPFNNNQFNPQYNINPNNKPNTFNPPVNYNNNAQNLYNEFLNENHGGAPLPDFIKEDIQPKIFREQVGPSVENLEAEVLEILKRNGIGIENKTVVLEPDVKIKIRNTSLSLREIEKLVSFNARLMRKCGENLEFCMIKDNVLDEEIASEIQEGDANLIDLNEAGQINQINQINQLNVEKKGVYKGKTKGGKGMNFLEIENGKNGGDFQNEIDDLLAGENENEEEVGGQSTNLEDFDIDGLN